MNRRAISPILSVIILIGIATIGGGLLYGIQNQVLTVGLVSLDLRVTDLKMEKDASGSCYFQSEFYNSGTDSVESIFIKTTLDSGEDFVRKVSGFGDELVPRNSTENFEFLPASNNECGNFTVSNTYSVRINATSFDSSFSTIEAMKVENVTES